MIASSICSLYNSVDVCKMQLNIMEVYMKFELNYKFILIIVASMISSLATFPYGYQFSHFLHFSTAVSSLIAGCVFGVVSCLANAILGMYSLLGVHVKKNAHTYIIIVLSTLGAIPTGFFSYFGYRSILPSMLNIAASLVVLIVNSAINFTAVFNLWESTKKYLSKKQNSKKTDLSRTIFCIIGAMIGAIMSLTAYLATTNGIAHMISDIFSNKNTALHIASVLAFIAWLPLGALYLNAMGFVMTNCYDFVKNINKNIKEITASKIFLIIFVLLSGTAFSRMVYVFYNSENMIPAFFKLPSIQYLAYHYFIPLALISSAAVNYFALINILKPEKNKQFLDVIP